MKVMILLQELSRVERWLQMVDSCDFVAGDSNILGIVTSVDESHDFGTNINQIHEIL